MSRKRDQPYTGKITNRLDVLFGESTSEEKVTNSIPLDQIQLPSQQPRRYFDPQALQELVASVKQHGILQPLLVRPRDKNKYELVAGERRYRAAREVGLTEVPVVIRELSNEEAFQLALIENLQREDLNPIEETEGILNLLGLRLNKTQEEMVSLLYRMRNQAKGHLSYNVIANPEQLATDPSSYNVISNSEQPVTDPASYNVISNSESARIQEVFESLGKMTWDSFIINRLPLLKLPDEIQEALRSGKIAYTKALAIAKVKDSSARNTLLSEAIQKNLSLSQIKERVQTQNQELKPAKDELPERIKAAYQRVKKTQIWKDPKKRQQLETLLAQLEALTKQE